MKRRGGECVSTKQLEQTGEQPTHERRVAVAKFNGRARAVFPPLPILKSFINNGTVSTAEIAKNFPPDEDD